MTARPQRTRVDTRPGRTLAMVALSMVTLVLAGGLVWMAYSTIRTSREGRTVVTATAQQALPPRPAHLLLTLDRAGRPVSALILSPAPTSGGTLLVVPVHARVTGKPGVAPTRLSDAFSHGGLSEFSAAVGRFLGIEIASSTAENEAALTALMDAVAPVSLTFDQPVLDTDENRSDRVLFPVGAASLDSAAIARVVLAQREGESERDRLPRIEALWNAIAVRSAALPAPASPSDGTVAALLGTVLHGPTIVYRFPAVATEAALRPTGIDMLDVSDGEVQLAVAKYLPGTVVTTTSNAPLVAGSTTTTSILASSVKP
jgi:hypothetical protein